MTSRPTDSPDRAAIAALVEGWLPGASLTAKQFRAIRRAAILAGSAVGVVDDLAPEPFDPVAQPYVTTVIARAIDGAIRERMQVRATRDVPFEIVEVDGEPPLATVKPAALVPRVDVNTAGVDALAALIGLGAVSARRIVSHRLAFGLYVALDDVRRVSGVSTEAFDKAVPFLHIGDGSHTRPEPVIETNLRASGLTALLEGLKSGAVTLPESSASTPEQQLVELVTAAADRVRATALRPRFWRPSLDRLRRGAVSLSVADESEAAGDAQARVAPVFSAGYLPLLRTLLESATSSVNGSMFYFSLGNPPDPGHPGAQVVDALAAAVDRGVDVRLILDDDLEGDRHGAHIVNEHTFQVLQERKIPFRRDHLEVTSHAKTLVVDGRHVLLGSHNWTASSFFVFEETSCYVDSIQLGSSVRALFDRRWLLLADVAAERVIPIEQLELLTPVQQAAVIEAGLANGSAFIGATRTRSQREALEPVIRVGAEDQLRVRRVVRLMQAFKISETTAVTLVAAGLDAPSEVERASRVRLREVFADLSKLPEPFRLRQLSSEFADWLATQEA